MKANCLLLVTAIILFVSCKKSEESLPKEDQAVIDGNKFYPAMSDAKRSGNNFIISFESGTKKIEIVTNDTINGTYTVVAQSLKSATVLKSASVLKANITYTDGNTSYYGTNGTVSINKGSAGFVSGSYKATVTYGGTSIEISEGYFEDIEVVITLPLIETEAAINDTLLTCYSKLHKYVEHLYLFDAVYSNSITAPDGSWTEIYNHAQTQTSNNGKILALWSEAYDIILKTNLIVESSAVAISDQATQNIIIAQAKAMRAYLFCELMNWFGEIPLDTDILEIMIPRNTVSDVLMQIRQDATDASQSLPVSWPISDKFRIPKGFANALRAKAALCNSDYDEAVSQSLQIINSAIYTLGADNNNFTATNPEIFCGFDKTNNTVFNSFFNKGSYVPVFRYTEIYLIYAEALFKKGNAASAKDYINALNARGSIPIVTSLTADVILQKWNTELVKEGRMFASLKRFGEAVSIVQDYPHKLVLPVPLPVIINNPYLTQNAGY